MEGNHCCEDCYWEIFLLTTETKRDHDTTTDYSSHDVIISTASTNTSNTKPSTTSEPEGFGGGFGGGQFSGGGAGASWTEGDMQSLDSVDGQSGLLTDNDDTFFYS